MALKPTKGLKLVLKVGNGASPEVFTPMCTINAERGITFTAQTNEEVIEDCDDVEAVGWVVREKTGLSMEFTGGGMNHKQDNVKLFNWLKSPDPVNCQIVMDDDVAANDILFEGAYHLTQYDITGEKRQRVKSQISLQSSGEVTATFGSSVD